MFVTPKMDRDNYTKMLLSLKAYSRAGGLVKMSTEELENMPKEVMIALASKEIAVVWHKLPNNLKCDTDIKKYQYCDEHYNNRKNGGCGGGEEEEDEGDGPAPRKIFCCYCKIRDVKITTENSLQNISGMKRSLNLNPLNCCKGQQ